MTASGRPPNQWLQMLDAADFDLLRPHLVTIELVRETVLGEAGAALRHVLFPHHGTVSITVGPPEGQTIKVAMLGRDSIIRGSAALAEGIAASSGGEDADNVSATTVAACGHGHNTSLGDCPSMTVNTEPIANISH